MKIRTDYVTNSSSSSFIINRRSDYQDAESIYQYIRKLYIEWLNTIERVNKDYGKDVVKMSFNEQYKIQDSFREKYGFSIYDVQAPYGGTDWLKCQTYEEYKEYWAEKEDCIYNYPFSIISRDEMRHDERDVVGWYVPCYNINNTGEDFDCDDCDHCEVGCDSRRICEELQSGNFDSVDYFGNVCVCSESGFIPDTIVEKLSEECNLWCNHMG